MQQIRYLIVVSIESFTVSIDSNFANNIIRSLMYGEKKVGTGMVPWGTPALTSKDYSRKLFRVALSYAWERVATAAHVHEKLWALW